MADSPRPVQGLGRGEHASRSASHVLSSRSRYSYLQPGTRRRPSPTRQARLPVTPIEAYLRPDSGRYLDPWYTHLKDAYLATMADLGVTPDMEGQVFLDAMAASKTADPEMLMVLRAIKATAKGGIGKLREHPRDTPLGQPWPALSRPTWRPDIRAAVLSTSRIVMHRKIMKMAPPGHRRRGVPGGELQGPRRPRQRLLVEFTDADHSDVQL